MTNSNVTNGVLSRFTQKKDSRYVITGIILAMVAALLDIFLWRNINAVLSATTGSLALYGFLWLFILQNEHPEEFPTLFITPKPRESPYRGYFALGVSLINFAVTLVASAILGAAGFIVSWFVWEVLMNVMEETREEHSDNAFWILIGSVMYFLSYIIPIIIFAVRT